MIPIQKLMLEIVMCVIKNIVWFAKIKYKVILNVNATANNVVLS